MTQSRTRFAGRGYDPAAALVEARRAWLALLQIAREHVTRVLDGHLVDKIEQIKLANLTVRHRAQFPVRQASVQNIAEASLILLRGFVAAATAEDRCAVAEILQPALSRLDAKLLEDGHAMAQRSRLWAGDTD